MMSLTAKNAPSGEGFKKVPQGTHLAICNQIIDLGNQVTDWQGQEKIQHKCYIRWELPHERMEWTDKDDVKHEGPMSIGKTYTVGLGEKYSMKIDFEAWRGKAFTTVEQAGFAVKNVLGTGCQVNVVHKTRPSDGSTYAFVAGLASWPKGVPVVEPENALFYYDKDSKNYDELPQWAKDKIGQAVGGNVQQIKEDEREDDFSDSIPF